MKITNGVQMREIDQRTINEYGIPGIVLMENAGRAVLEEVLKSITQKEYKEVVIVSGRGNNGGDGYVVARHLYNRGFPVKVFIIGSELNLPSDARINYEILKRLHVNIKHIVDEKDLFELSESISKCGLIVDAILGTGLTREVNSFMQRVITIINEAQKEVIAIDIPSGVSADSGQICGTAVKADKTVVFQLPKIGNINYPGTAYGGEIKVKDIGIPKVVIDYMNLKINMVTEDMIKNILRPRKKDTHKGSYGKACIVAGSTGMTGAAILTCKAALRSGVGLLKIAVPKSLNDIIETTVTEAITVPLPEFKKGFVGIGDIEKIIETMEQSDVIALGPGSGQSKELEKVLMNVFEQSNKPILLDADALNSLASKVEMLEKVDVPVIMSPHVGEMARLTGRSIEDINKNRIEVAKEFAQKWNVTVVLKGARTVIAGKNGDVFINLTGNPGMATAGSGDVLTGILTAFVAQGIDTMQAAIAAVYVHGVAGDLGAQKRGEYGLIASDILEEVPFVIKQLVKK